MIDLLITTPIAEAEDLLWAIGLNSHELSKRERMAYIAYLAEWSAGGHPKTILNAMGYLTHTYFSQMDDSEKRSYLGLLMSILPTGPEMIGEILEIVGLVFKGCPDDMKDVLYRFVLANSGGCRTNPAAVMAMCNCYSSIFSEVDIQRRNELVLELESTCRETPFLYVRDSIDFTVDSLLRRCAG